MKVLSWNILASEWIESKYYPKIPSKTLFDRKKRFATILKLLKKSKADVILLQEVMKDEYNKLVDIMSNKYIISSLKLMYWSYSTTSNSGNATLLSSKLFSNVKHKPLTQGIHTTCEYAGAPVDVFNIHLDDMSTSKRATQLKQIIKKTISGRSIIAGDFNQNYTPRSPFFKIPGYIVNINCPTYFIEKKLNLDNILTKGFKSSKGLPCEWYPESQEMGLKRYGSDHIPVSASVV